MSEKRRDSKNRILRSEEKHRKEGRYAHKYIDAADKPQFVYSWNLEATNDITPESTITLSSMSSLRSKWPWMMI